MKKLLLLLMFSSVAAFGEYRIWIDQKGNSIEAELSGVDGEKIVLTTPDGKQYKLSPVVLSAGDQEYIKGKIPESAWPKNADPLDKLRLDHDFKKIKDTGTQGGYDQMRCSVTIKRDSNDPYDGKLKACVYVIGESRYYREYLILDKIEQEFGFSRGREVTLSGKSFSVYNSYGINYGVEYRGHLIVVTSESGKDVYVKGSRSEYEENRKKIETFDKGQYFSNKFQKTDMKNTSGRYY